MTSEGACHPESIFIIEMEVVFLSAEKVAIRDLAASERITFQLATRHVCFLSETRLSIPISAVSFRRWSVQWSILNFVVIGQLERGAEMYMLILRWPPYWQ